MEKSIIIIGAGLAGLSAGCYGRMNGYRTSVFEMHDKAGGVCTGWKRNGYTIDGAMNLLAGTKPGTNNYKFWEELGATKDWKIYNHELHIIDEGKDKKPFYVYCDADRLEHYLLEFAPEDKKPIMELTAAVRELAGYDFPVDKPHELYDSFEMSKVEKMIPRQLFEKWGTIPIQEFSERFKNPALKMLPYLFGLNIVWMLQALTYQHNKSAGYVIGGALALVKSIEKRYRELGGEIQFKSKVTKILVEKDKAVGIKLDDGTECRADYVISAGDGRSTIFSMLEGRYIDDTIKKMYEAPGLVPPLVYVGLGVNRSFDDVPPSISGLIWHIDKPINIDGNHLTHICPRVYNFDPTLAPAGKNTVVVQYNTGFDYWKNLKEHPDKYKAEKDRIANDVIDRLDKRFPGITEQVEMVDVATPVTWENYTGNWQGSYEGWIGQNIQISKTLPGLENFYMAGQWVNPGGGMATAVMSGNHTIQFICKKDKKEFETNRK